MTQRVWLSGVSSVTHLVHAASWLRTQSDVTLVDLGSRSFLGRRNVTEQDVLAWLPADLARDRGLGAGPDERLTYLAIGAPGLKPWARLRAAHPGRRLRVVVVDEGLGSYGDWRARRDASAREGGGRLWPTVRARAVATGSNLLTDERWALYREQAGGWVVDPRVAAEFRRDLVPVADRSRAVLLTQPWAKLGILDAEQVGTALREAARQCERAGLDLLVRPHPAELAPGQHGVATDPGRGPAELDPRVVGAAVVLGTASTALLNLRALHGTPALRISLPGVDEVDACLSPRQRSLLDTWLPAPVALAELSRAITDLPYHRST